MRQESIQALFRTEALCGLDERALGFFGDFRFHSSSLNQDRERSHLQTLDTFTFTAAISATLASHNPSWRIIY